MAKGANLSKAARLHRICHLLYRNPQGLTAQELSRFCNVTKRTVQRDLHDLESEGIPLWDDASRPPRYGIIEGYYLPPIHLTLNDALALFLAARLLARYADSFDPHVPGTLAKLAQIMPQPIADHTHTTIRHLTNRREDASFVHVLETLALGWASSRKVHMRHRAAGSENVHEYTFCPYFIEPSGVGNATYAIGHASYFDDIHTFKVERISHAVLTDENFEPPEDFDGPALLDSAWGIMYGPETTEVVLRFEASATRRIKETRWHPSQELEDIEGGACILRLEVAHPEEMMYWIRGWGPKVEVLKPPWLRQRIRREALETVRRYERSENA